MTLFHIVDPNNNTFSVRLYKNLSTNTTKIQYAVKLKNQDEEILDWESVDIVKGDKFYAGLNINNVIRYFGGAVATVLGNISQCKLFIGSTELNGLENSFLGNIYKVGLCNDRNSSLVASSFGADGLPAE